MNGDFRRTTDRSSPFNVRDKVLSRFRTYFRRLMIAYRYINEDYRNYTPRSRSKSRAYGTL